MFVTKTVPKLTVAVSEGTVASIQTAAGKQKDTLIENLDGANTLTYRWQFSDDEISWTDVAPNSTVPPGGRVRTILSGHIFHRLRGLGNLNIALKVDSELEATTSFIFTS